MRHLFILTYGWLLQFFRSIISVSDKSLKIIYAPGFARLRSFNGKVKAYKEFVHAYKNVPAYKHFLETHGFKKVRFKGFTPDMTSVPATDKRSYVQLYPIETRCIQGKIPDNNIVIDESSGSSGTATNWVRGIKERSRNARFIRMGLQNLFGNEPMFIINAFALGPWATGMNITMSCLPFAKIKSLGPDCKKIENTLVHFGKKHQYLVMGYPPFLKMLADEAEIDFHNYNVSFIFGGESMSEGMRDYLLGKGIRKIYSSFGASDLELNIAAENDFTIYIRRLLMEHTAFREKLIKVPGALPMVFQYNPADFLIDTASNGDMIITLCRPGYLSPKIRYNIHDRGQIVTVKKLLLLLKEFNLPIESLPSKFADLNLLLHYGRSDMTVSFFGANISPNDIQETLFLLPTLAKEVRSFCIQVVENADGSKKLIIHMEVPDAPSLDLENKTKSEVAFFIKLALVNQDFREARRMAGKHLTSLQFHTMDTGPFKNADIRIKARYIDQNTRENGNQAQS